MWSRDFAARAAVIGAVARRRSIFSVVSGANRGLASRFAGSVRLRSGQAYLRRMRASFGLVLRAQSAPLGHDGIPAEFSFGCDPGQRLHHFEPVLLDGDKPRAGARTTPASSKFFCGPESFTPTMRYLSGRSRGSRPIVLLLRVQFVGTSVRRRRRRAWSQWICDGHPPVELWEVDVRRNACRFSQPQVLYARTIGDVSGSVCDMHWPFRQFETVRGVRKPALHDRLIARGVFGGGRRL